MGDLHEVSSRQMTTGTTEDPLLLCALVACEPSLIDNVRDKSTDLGMHSAGYRKEDAAFCRNGIGAVEEVLKKRNPTLPGMRALNRLGKLHGIAAQHDVRCAGSHRYDVRNRNLASFVYKQVVEARVEIDARKQPSRTTHDRSRKKLNIVIPFCLVDSSGVNASRRISAFLG